MSNPFAQNDLPLIQNAEIYLWRDAYQGGSYFRDKYLQTFKDEKFEDFCRRKAMAPTTDFAKSGINRILAQVARLLADVIRRGGNEQYQQAVAGHNRGVDGRGSSMNAWLTKLIIPDLLVVGRVGALVDAPGADRTGDAPYFCTYRAEQIQRADCAEPLSPSDYKDVLLEETDGSYLHYFIDENGVVCWQKFDKSKSQTVEPQLTDLDAIPFAICDIGSSLMSSRRAVSGEHVECCQSGNAIRLGLEFFDSGFAWCGATGQTGTSLRKLRLERRGAFCGRMNRHSSFRQSQRFWTQAARSHNGCKPTFKRF